MLLNSIELVDYLSSSIEGKHESEANWSHFAEKKNLLIFTIFGSIRPTYIIEFLSLL